MPKAVMRNIVADINVMAEDVFTDREAPREAFWDLYNSLEADSYEVIAYYGVGGVGKTTLLKKIGREIDEKIDGGKNDHLFFSFENKPDKEFVLYSWSRQLILCNKNLSCPLFDAAFKRLLELEGKESSQYEARLSGELLDNPLLQSAIDIVGTVSPIPGVSAATNILRRIVTFTNHKMDEYEKEHGSFATIYKIIQHSDNKELRKNLHEYLKLDIHDCMAKRERPFVFLLDGYENFVDIRETGYESMELERDGWLKNGYSGFASLPNVIWVLAGRELPHWEQEVLPQEHLHRVGDLSKSDTFNFLHKVGIYDEILREHIYSITNGTPAYLDLCVNTFRQIKNEREPIAEDFGRDTSELAQRFLEGMNQEMRKMVIVLASLPNVWSIELAKQTAEVSGYGYCVHSLEEVLSMSLIERVDGGYKLHKTVKDILSSFSDISTNDKGCQGLSALLLDDVNNIENIRISCVKQFVGWLLNSKDTDYRMGVFRNLVDTLSCVKTKCIEESDMSTLIDIFSCEEGTWDEIKEIIDVFVLYVVNENYGAEIIVKCQNIQNEMNRKLGLYNLVQNDSLNTYEFSLANLGKENIYTLKALSNLGNIFTCVGNYKKAKSILEEVYELYKKVKGENHELSLVALDYLGMSYYYLGEYETARELLERCYRIKKQVLGEEHPTTLITLGNLALPYINQGNYDKACELTEQCYEIKKQILGEMHPSTLTTLGNLAQVYSEQGNYDKACELTEQCYEIKKQILGEEHPSTLTTLGNLATVYMEQGNYDKARVLTEQCYEIERQVLGETHPSTLTTLGNLAIVYMEQGNYDKACELVEQCYDIRKRILGEEHLLTLTVLEDFAYVCYEQENYSKACELEEQLYETRKRVLGEEHPSTLKALSDLALFYDEQGNYSKACELAELCYEKEKRILGEEHLATLTTLGNLALTYNKQGNYSKACELAELCYEKEKRTLGEEHISTLTMLENLAWIYEEQGDYSKACELTEHCYETKKRVLGEKHPDTFLQL